MNGKHIAVVCGGTGGHVMPGLATARVLVKRGHTVTLWLGDRAVESAAAAEWDGPVVRIRAAGFGSGLSLRSLTAACHLLGACAAAYRRLRANPPDTVLAMGGYASVGPVIAARLQGIPIVLHEANAVPGRAISLLSGFASSVAIAFDSARRYFGSTPVTLTGLPLRAGIAGAAPLEGFSPDRFTILVMGGSQGARVLNQIAPAALSELHRRGTSFLVIHLAGASDESNVRGVYEAAGIENRVYGFLQDIGRAYASASIAVCRAGAGACAELAVCGLPALLVPLPSARRDHQLANARELESKGGVDVVLQKDLDEKWLANYMKNIASDRPRLEGMKEAMKKSAVENAADRLAELVENASV